MLSCLRVSCKLIRSKLIQKGTKLNRIECRLLLLKSFFCYQKEFKMGLKKGFFAKHQYAFKKPNPVNMPRCSAKKNSDSSVFKAPNQNDNVLCTYLLTYLLYQ